MDLNDHNVKRILINFSIKQVIMTKTKSQPNKWAGFLFISLKINDVNLIS
jgi:hypothetical protein